MNRSVSHLIHSVERRYRSVWTAWVLCVAWCLLGVMYYFGWFDPWIESLSVPNRYIVVGLTILAIPMLAWCIGWFRYKDHRWVAHRIEEQFPNLRQRLITAVQVTDERNYFQRSVIDETIAHGRTNDWTQTVSDPRLFCAWACQFVALAFAVWLALFAGHGEASSAGSKLLPALSNSALSSEVRVEPGDVEIEKGTDLVVTARFPNEVPPEVWLVSGIGFQPVKETEATAKSLMIRSLKDPVFGGYIRNVQSDFNYKVEFGAGETKTHKATVFEYPAMVRSDAIIEPPKYAAQEPRTVENTRRVTVADGAKLTWSIHVNKPLASVQLIDEDSEVTVMQPQANEPTIYTVAFEMTQSKRWKVQMSDSAKRSAKIEEELVAKVLQNSPPEMKLSRASDLRVSPLQEVQIKATAKDDFGIVKSGITVVMGDHEPEEISLEAKASQGGKTELQHMVDLEKLEAQPDQLLSYYFWAEDLDRDGQQRRVDGEMFFAEVRPFEEIYREGQQQSQQQQQQQQQQQSEGEQGAEELAELQKQIVTATWNQIRQGVKAKNAQANVETILESQKSAREKTDALEEKLQDEKSLEYLQSVRQSMDSALGSLAKWIEATDKESLRGPLEFERKAYEGLLRLRAREHQIVKSQQQSRSSSKSSSKQNRQAQLDQLKLQDEQKQFENEQQAESPEPSAQRENRQVMNRLEELAKRQKDINEQLKDLETAIREAQTQEQKQELEEQLKRLRDNQEELLRDSDELLERMNQPENRQAMQQAREQTEQAREQLQQSSESLAKGETSQARSAGTRAQRQLDETREQMRKESSNQFEQTMRDLVEDAEKLEKKQKELAQDKKLEPSSAPEGTDASPLRPEGNEQSAKSNQQAWRDQKKELNELLEKMRETVSEAESSEPLLAEQLYESFREAKQKGIEQKLDQVPMLVERGLEEPAAKAIRDTTEGIQKLREQIEEASESVLGSEQESLRKALAELQRAQRQLGVPSEDAKSGGLKSEDLKSQNSTSSNEQQSESRQGERQPGSQRRRSQQPNGQPHGDQPQGDQPRDPQQGNERQPNEQQGDSQTSDGQQPSSQQQGNGQQRDGQQRDGQPRDGQQQPNQGGPQQSPQRQDGQQRNGSNTGGPNREGTYRSGPITNENYAQWVDSLRDVEELVRDPALRAEVGRVREAAREMRIEYKRHAKEPEFDLVQRLIANPLSQVKEKVQEELLRLNAEKNALVPIDRDPVPSPYQRQLDRYYENLGSGK